MKFKDPHIRLYGDEIRFYMHFMNERFYDRLINSARSFICKVGEVDGKGSERREIIPLRLEMPEENICKGKPNAICVCHITMVWEKFTMLEDEVLIIELSVDARISEFELEASYINNVRLAETDDIYFVDPDYNFPDN